MFATLAGAVAAGGCSSSSSSAPPAVPCAAPSGPIAMVYPAPGSSGIPDNFPGVVLASQSGLTVLYQALVVPSAGGSYAQLAFVSNAPSPLPSPNQLPTFTNPIYQLSAFTGLLNPATPYTVYLNNQSSSCTPAALGTFTSQ